MFPVAMEQLRHNQAITWSEIAYWKTPGEKNRLPRAAQNCRSAMKIYYDLTAKTSRNYRVARTRQNLQNCFGS